MDLRLERYLEEKREELIEDIAALVAIPSIHGQKESCRQALAYMARRAADFGMTSRMTAEEDVCVIELGAGEEILGILVHVDVVDPGDPEKWRTPPFTLSRTEEALWGRGTVDDKGPAMVCLYVLRALKELGYPLNKRLWLIVGSCEEGIWTDMEHFKAQFQLPAFGFTPDGNFPLYNVEKGYADVCLTFPVPPDGSLLALSAGESRNSIPSLAVIRTREGGERIYQGVSAHSSAPELGDNAIVKLCRDLADACPYPFLRFVSRFLEDWYVPGLALDDGSEYYQGERVGRTTAVPTVLRLEESGVTLNINLRHRFGVTGESILAGFRRYEQEYGFRTELVECLDPLMVSENHPALRLMDRIYREHGYEGAFLVAPGCTYAKSMDNFVCWGPVFPGDPDCAHMENEHLLLDGMMESAKLYADYLVRAAAGTELESSAQ